MSHSRINCPFWDLSKCLACGIYEHKERGVVYTTSFWGVALKETGRKQTDGSVGSVGDLALTGGGKETQRPGGGDG